MGFFDDVVDTAQDTVEDVQDEVEEKVDKAKEVAGNVQDEVEDQVDNAQETVDKAKDTVEKATGSDLDNDGNVGSSSSGSSGGSSGGSSSTSSSSGGSSGGSRDISSSGGSSGGSSGSTPETQKQAREALGISDRDKKDLSELSNKEIDQTQKARGPIQEAVNPGTSKALKSQEQINQAEQNINQNISKVKSAGENEKIKFGGETVSQDQALNQLQSQKQTIQETENRLQRQFDNYLEGEPEKVKIPESAKEKEEVGPKFSRSPTDDKLTNQYASGTKIQGGYSQGSTLSNPEIRKGIKQDLETRGDVMTLATTSAGFTALGVPFDQNESLETVVESKQREGKDRGFIGDSVEFLGSPAGLVATGGLGKAVGAGVKSLQASGVGTGRVASAVGTGAKTVGAGFVGLQAGKGAKNIQSGNVAKGVGQITQVTAETGAFTKGLRSAYQKYGKRLGRTTEVNQDNVLRQVQTDDNGQLLVGSGEMTARTPVIRNKVRGGVEKVDEAVTKAKYKIEADGSGSQAKGTLTEKTPGADQIQKKFESFSNVVQRNDEKVVSNNILRTEKEGRLFRYTNDKTSQSISRKESEKPVNEIRSFSENKIEEPVEIQDALGRTNIITKLERDVVDQIRRGNLNARNIELSTYSRNQDGEVFSETNNLVFNKQNGGNGGGSFGGNGQGLKYGGSSGGQGLKNGAGLRNELRRQSKAGNQFGEMSREVAQNEIESGSRLQGFSTGGSGGQGAQAEAQTENFQVQRRSGQTAQNIEVQETQNQSNLRVSRTRTGEKLRKDLGTRSGGSGVTTRSGTPGLQERNSQRQGNPTLNDVREGLGQKGRSGNGLKTKQGRGLKEINKVGQKGITGTSQIPKTGLKAFQVPKLKAQTVPKVGSTTITTATPTPTTVTGLGLPLQLEGSKRLGIGTSEGNRNPGKRPKKDINLDILSANRSELLTGKKTFSLDKDEVTEFSQSPFSGGLKTKEDQKLGKRKYKSNKEVEFF